MSADDLQNGFVACLNCMDGRTQLSVISYVQQKSNMRYVDMITEAGIDGVCLNAKNNDEQKKVLEHVLNKLRISVEKHDAKEIFVVGHSDCAGNSVETKIHEEGLLAWKKYLDEHFPSLKKKGIFLDVLKEPVAITEIF